MSVKVNVRRTIKINGREYGSLDEVPEGLREAVSRALAGSSPGSPEEASGVRAAVVFNGVTYPSVDAMPPDVRQLYASIMKAADAGAPLRAPARSGDVPRPTEFESPFSARAALVGLLAVAVLLLLYYAWQAR